MDFCWRTLDDFFGDIPTLMNLNCLSVHWRRHEVTRNLANLIRREADLADSCRRVVDAISDFHRLARTRNAKTCKVGISHNLLFVAAKLCYEFSLRDSEAVSNLLDNIYLCEGSFEKLFVGGVVGLRVSRFVCGWRSDFEDEEECLEALEYFMDHAVTSKLTYKVLYNVQQPCTAKATYTCRFVDVPLMSYDRTPPLFMASHMSKPQALLLLLRYGARITPNSRFEDWFSTNPIYWCPISFQLNALSGVAKRFKREAVVPYPRDAVACLRFLTRAVPKLRVRLRPESKEDFDEFHVNEAGECVIHPRLHEDGVIPPSLWLHPPLLKHMCRCVIRNVLRGNWQLPMGIYKLKLPVSVEKYLDLQED